jgi:Glycosyltransferase
MRILQLATKVPYPPKDGGAAGIYIFSEVFSKLGHAVTLLAVNPPKHFISDETISEVPAAIQIKAIPVNTNPVWPKALVNLLFQSYPYQIVRFINKDYKAKLIELLCSQKPEIVQIEGIYMCPYIPVIRKHSDAKIVLRAHNVEYILWNDIAANEKNMLKRIYLKIQAKRLKKYELEQLSKVNGITTVTNYDLGVLAPYTKLTNIKVVPFGLYPLPYEEPSNVNLNAIAFIGALDWMPNQEAIVWFLNEAWPKIFKRFPDLRFHLAGRNAPNHLVSLAKQQEGVVFHGEVPDSKVFLSQFSLVIVPLFSGSGIRVKIIEAMQHGKVVIASTKAADGIPAIPGKHLIIADSAEEFLTAIANFMEHPETIAQISSDAKAFIQENFNILAIGSELIDFYKELIHD